MGLDMYFRRDIANVLRATACASEGAAGLAMDILGTAEGLPDELRAKLDAAGIPAEQLLREQLLRVYRQGVRNTLVSVGLAFGLEPVGPSTQVRTGASSALAGLLWAETPRD